MSAAYTNLATKECEESWHRLLLILILIAGTGARIYALDQTSLSSNELRNLGFCQIPGWLNMVLQLNMQTGTPPLYATLLCQFTDLTSTAEFFVRLLSVMAGIASIYLVYLTGRDFLSPSTGLLAAAFVSTAFHNIHIDRTATLHALLTLTVLLHNYCFSWLLFRSPFSAAQPFTLSYKNDYVDFQWIWTPPAKCNAYCLIGFWITGIAAFYTSSTTLVLFLYELLVYFYLASRLSIAKPERQAVSRLMWLPLLIATLPWLPVMASRLQWVLEGNFLAMPGLSDLMQKLSPLLPPDNSTRLALLTMALLLVMLLGYPRLRFKKPLAEETYLVYLAMMMAFVSGCTWVVIGASHLALFGYANLLLLMLAFPAGYIISRFTLQRAKLAATSLFVFAILIYQSNSNFLQKIYLYEGDADFRTMADIIHHDNEFMESHRSIFLSDTIFQHYLEIYQVKRDNLLEINPHSALTHLYQPDTKPVFYYLEYTPYDRDHQAISEAQRSLQSQYKTECVTSLPWLQLFRFSDVPPSTETAPHNCQDYIPVVTLQ